MGRICCIFWLITGGSGGAVTGATIKDHPRCPDFGGFVEALVTLFMAKMRGDSREARGLRSLFSGACKVVSSFLSRAAFVVPSRQKLCLALPLPEGWPATAPRGSDLGLHFKID